MAIAADGRYVNCPFGTGPGRKNDNNIFLRTQAEYFIIQEFAFVAELPDMRIEAVDGRFQVQGYSTRGAKSQQIDSGCLHHQGNSLVKLLDIFRRNEIFNRMSGVIPERMQDI